MMLIIQGSFHDNLINIFRNNRAVKCHLRKPLNQQISPIDFFLIFFTFTVLNLFYSVVRHFRDTCIIYYIDQMKGYMVIWLYLKND
jgi:hypothetical protein